MGMKSNCFKFLMICGVGFSCVRGDAALRTLPVISSWNSGTRTALIEELLKPETDINASKAELKAWLIENSTASKIRHPSWPQVLRICEWQVLREKVHGIDAGTWRWMMNDAELTESLFRNLKPEDNPQKVLELLQTFHQAAPDYFPKYNSLALAFAMVWDKPLIPKIHRQIGAAKIPTDASTPLDRFRFYVECNAKAALEWDPSRLPVDCLKFMVDSAVSLDELRWAQKHVRVTRGKFDSVFSSIRYDHVRLDAGSFVWPGPDYRLADIQEQGGICVDQAYFAAVSGKAHGIPTLLFTGEGRRGGHAWFGYLKAMDRWDFDCGRYAYDKYATGSALDPQTRLVISDHELDYLSKRCRDQVNFQLSGLMVEAAKLHDEVGMTNKALALVTEAITADSRNYDAWLYREALLRAAGNVTGLKAQLESVIQRFASYPDIKVEAQKKLVDLFISVGKTNDARNMTASIVRQNMDERSDLGIEVLEENILKKMEADDFEGALRDFKTVVRRFEAETGAVTSLLSVFVNKCIEKKQLKTDSEAVEVVRKRVATGSPGTQKFLGAIEQRLEMARRGPAQSNGQLR